MNVLFETKAEIVKGTSKKGNTYYAYKIWLTKDYAMFKILENADLELVKNVDKSLSLNDKDV